MRVLDAISAYIVENGKSPTIREICVATGEKSEDPVWQSVMDLIDAGVVEWPRYASGKHKERGMRLLVRFNEPVRIPVIPYGDQDFVPGDRWLEIVGGDCYYVYDDRRVKCKVISHTSE